MKTLSLKYLPVTFGKGGNVFRIIPPKDLFTVAYLWEMQIEEKPIEEDLFPLQKIHTVHEYGYHGCFKPSIAEVIYQIPGVYRNLDALYFDLHGPEDDGDLNLWVEHVQAGVHVARCDLYMPVRKGSSGLEQWVAYCRANPEMLSLDRHVTRDKSAFRWLSQMTLSDRAEVMRYFCRVCGEQIGDDELHTPAEDNYCVIHSPDSPRDSD